MLNFYVIFHFEYVEIINNYGESNEIIAEVLYRTR